MMKSIDLHAHTNETDRNAWHRRSLSTGKENPDLPAVAVTDHDTVGGLLRPGQRGEKLEGLGIEVSTGWQHTEIHLLGYLFDPAAPGADPTIEWVINDRRERNDKNGRPHESRRHNG